MTRLILKNSLLWLALAWLAAPSAAASADLRIYNWSNYIAPETLASFQARTGLEIAYANYDSIAELEQRLAARRAAPVAAPATARAPAPDGLPADLFADLPADLFADLPANLLQETGNTDFFDILIVPVWQAERLARDGRIALLEKEKLPRFISLDPLLVQWLPQAPLGQTYALPYLWGTSGLAWDSRAQGEKVVGWDALFSPQQAGQRASCGIGLAAEPADLLSAALAYDAANANGIAASRQDALAAAERQLMAASAHSAGFFSSWGAARGLAEGRLCLAQLRAPDLFRLIQSGAVEAGRFSFVLPQEGALGWMDVMVVAKNANMDAAYQWLNFLLEAPIAAANAASVGHGVVVVDAQEFLPASMVDNPLLSPSAAGRAKLARFGDDRVQARQVQARLEAWLAAGRP